MKKIVRLSLTAIALSFFFSAFAVRETKAQANILNEILKRMDAHQKALTSLQANVMMDKYNSQLDEHDVSEGSILYFPVKQRDPMVRIDWTKPVQETLAVVNKQYVLLRTRLNQAIIGKVDEKSANTKSNGALSFLNMSKDQLRTNYDVVYLGQENVSGNIPAWHLKMTPKTPTGYQYGEVWVDGNGMPVQMKITERNNDSTTVLLSNLQKNVTIDPNKFKVSLKGVNVVKA